MWAQCQCPHAEALSLACWGWFKCVPCGWISEVQMVALAVSLPIRAELCTQRRHARTNTHTQGWIVLGWWPLSIHNHNIDSVLLALLHAGKLVTGVTLCTGIAVATAPSESPAGVLACLWFTRTPHTHTHHPLLSLISCVSALSESLIFLSVGLAQSHIQSPSFQCLYCQLILLISRL